MALDLGTIAHVETAAAAPASSGPVTEIYFGGPDQPPRALRDVLKARIDAAPPGSEITWATYYFRDQDLAESLVAARNRGVKVRMRLEASPRRGSANDTVIQTLQAGLGDGFRLHKAWFGASHLTPRSTPSPARSRRR